jgi:RimJ/RimL family protein N-acetyltransferase
MAYEVSSIKMDDSIPIMRWRNEQISSLRQSKPLTEKEQLAYFEETVRPQFSQEKPEQVLLRFTHEDKLIGYGGLVHLNWEDARGEVSFLLEPERAKDRNLYERECKLFMNLLMKCAFLTLNLNKISTEAYSHRGFHVRALESSGFTREGILREQTQVRGKWTDAVIASCLKSEYLGRASNGKE